MPTFADGEAADLIREKLNAVLGACELILDPATLVADTALTYTTGQARTVSVGSKILSFVGGHRYEVVASDATTYDLETAGGVRVSLLPRGDGWYDFDGMAPVKDGATDCLGLVNKLLDNKAVINGVGERIGPSIAFGYGQHYFSDTINPKCIVRFYGFNSGISNVRGTDFIFPAATAGIVVNRHNTLGDQTVSSTYGADGSEFVGLRLTGGRGDAFDETLSGIWLRARARVERCVIRSFAGHAVYAGAGSDGNPYLGNCNLFRIFVIFAQFNRGSGVHIEGTDANAGTCAFVDAKNNDLWCVYEDSFLGNEQFGHHSESNASGSYYSSNASFFHGCYTEDGSGGNWNVQGLALGNTISAANSGVGPVLGTEAANGPVALRNNNGGFRGTHDYGTTDIASEDYSILSARHSTTGISYPLRWLWETDGSGAFIRWASSATQLIKFNGSTTAATYGRSAAVGESLNIPTLFLGLNNAGRALTYSSAAPTTGTWARGDIVFNNAPSAAGKIGWVCTTAGTPGTWKAWGAIDA